jgi:putative ABC transport system permease protein
LFSIERRTQELGIRKVLGAGRGSILRLMSADFIRQAVVASCIALPVSWWLISHWLDHFAYRVAVRAGTFFITEGLILLIAFSVIGLLTLRAASADPVKTLRAE